MADVTYEGWEASLLIPGSGTALTITTEHLGTGDGANDDFYSALIPITDSAGDASDVETDTTVYVDGVDQTTAYTQTGATGHIDFSGGGGTTPPDGDEVTMTYYTKQTLGYATGVTLDYTNNNIEVFTLGQRLAKEIKEAQIEISGTIAYLYVDREIFGLVKSQGQYGNQTEFTLKVTIASGKTVTFTGVKFDNWDLAVATGELSRQNVTFRAKTIAIA